jgi:hypothetical protein
MEIVITAVCSLVGFSLGFLSGALYALSSVRKAIEGSKYVK